ncbi:MAG: U32 family peptidase [Eubacterium sp.]|nr:U32 family peptidase [Eubacterium sp.]
MNNIKRPEILAPCGNAACLYAAINAGADAVYLAGNAFGARAYAGNFNNEELVHAIEIAHLYGVKVYLTINTLIKNNEIKHIFNFLLPLYKAGLDAVLVQDFGIVRVVQELFPDLPIHSSTQMNITSHYGACLAKELKFERVVAARENSLDELTLMKQKSGLEVETFVHGAMCFSYSGRCLLSSMAGDRSGNRGRCAQPCRKMYDGSYKISMKDMCAITDLPSLVEKGMDSLKIEGRMKNEYYVASAVRCYKEIVDDIINGCYKKEKAEEYKNLLADIFNRGGFSTGYFFKHHGKDMIDENISGRRGVKALKIKDVLKGKIRITALTDINAHDDIAFLDDDYEEPVKLTTGSFIRKGQEAILNCPGTKRLRAGNIGYRVRSEKILSDIYENIINVNKKIDISYKVRLEAGKPLYIMAKANVFGEDISAEVSGDILDKAEARAVSDEDIISKLSKLGDTPFNAVSFEIENDSSCFVRMSSLNQLRRDLATMLERNIIDLKKRSYDKSKDSCLKEEELESYNPPLINNKELYITISTKDQMSLLVDYDLSDTDHHVRVIIDDTLCSDDIEEGFILDFISSLREKKIRSFVAMPYILRDGMDDLYIKKILKIIDKADGVYIRNIDSFALYRSYARENDIRKDVILASSLYCYNDEAFKEYYDLIREYSNEIIYELSYELSRDETDKLSLPSGTKSYMTFYGRIPVMVTAQMLTYDKMDLTDELSNQFVFTGNNRLGYNVLFNKAPLCLNRFREDIPDKGMIFTTESVVDMKNILDNLKNDEDVLTKESITTGHYNRAVL